MLIYASSDIHSPQYLKEFIAALSNLSETPDVFLLAGDVVDKNNIMAFKYVYEVLKKKFPSVTIVATFGNEEYRGYEKLYEALYKDITWLNDSYVVLFNGDLCIYGTRGALDKPTTWQARNIPGIERYYKELPYRVAKSCEELRKNGCKKIILLSHYGVTRANLVGEKESTYPFLACTAFSRIIRRDIVDLVVHGHVHLGKLEVVYVNNVPVYNVALPARSKVVEIKL